MQSLKLGVVAAATALIMAPAAAQGLSFNVGVVSLYKYQGIDQDTRDSKSFRPALQGGVDYDFGNGFYVGNWNSTGTFGDANLEINVFGGYAGQITDRLGFDVGLTRYVYPNDASWNFNEWHASLNWGIATATYSRSFGSGPDLARLGLDISQPLTNHLSLEGGVGFRNNANLGGAHDYHIGLRYDFGTGLSANAMMSGAQRSKVGDVGRDRLVFGLTQTF